MIPLLHAHRAAQRVERDAAGRGWEDGWDLVWCRPDGRPVETHRDWQEWKDLLAEARIGNDARLHDARHTAGTLLAEQGADCHVIQLVLGHAQVSTTLGYIHVTGGITRQAAGRMGQLLWG